MSSTSKQSKLAKEIAGIDANSIIPWEEVIRYVCSQTRKSYYDGQDSILVAPSDDPLSLKYLLDPLLPLNMPAIIYGNGESGKSLFSLLISIIVRLPFFDNPLGLMTVNEPSQVLYLDWELDEFTFRKRLSELVKGIDNRWADIRYRQMTTPLSDAIESIEREVVRENIALVVIDSLAPAACVSSGGTSYPHDQAISYFNSLRRLGITSLTIAHMPREGKDIYGSIFYRNLARSVWNCEGQRNDKQNTLTIKLANDKANLSGRHEPLHFQFRFEDGCTGVSRVDGNIDCSASLRDEIYSLLKKEGGKSVKEIGMDIGKPENTVRTVLNRGKGKNFQELEVDGMGAIWNAI